MAQRCRWRPGAAGLLALFLLLAPLPGGLVTAQAEVNVSGGDYSAYALSSTRENRTLSFTLSDVPKGGRLNYVSVEVVTGGVGQALAARDYTFDERNKMITVTNDYGFLEHLALGQYRLTMVFSPSGTAVANFFVFATDTINT